LKNTTILEDSDGRGTRGEIEARLRAVIAGFAKRVGCANMRHDGVAKRDLSWAWSRVMREQARCGMSFVARST